MFLYTGNDTNGMNTAPDFWIQGILPNETGPPHNEACWQSACDYRFQFYLTETPLTQALLSQWSMQVRAFSAEGFPEPCFSFDSETKKMSGRMCTKHRRLICQWKCGSCLEYYCINIKYNPTDLPLKKTF